MIENAHTGKWQKIHTWKMKERKIHDTEYGRKITHWKMAENAHPGKCQNGKCTTRKMVERKLHDMENGRKVAHRKMAENTHLENARTENA